MMVVYNLMHGLGWQLVSKTLTQGFDSPTVYQYCFHAIGYANKVYN